MWFVKKKVEQKLKPAMSEGAQKVAADSGIWGYWEERLYFS